MIRSLYCESSLYAVFVPLSFSSSDIQVLPSVPLSKTPSIRVLRARDQLHTHSSNFISN